MQGIKVSAIVPQQIANIMGHLMGPINCCAEKLGYQQPLVYIYDNKSYCEDCIKKAAEANPQDFMPDQDVQAQEDQGQATTVTVENAPTEPTA
jgi:hypothetical protein